MGKIAVITFGIVALWSISDARAVCRTVTDCSSGVCHPVRLCGENVPSYIPPPRVAPGTPVPGYVAPADPAPQVVIPVVPRTDAPAYGYPGYQGYSGQGYPGYYGNPLGVVPGVGGVYGGAYCRPHRICNGYGQCSVQQVCR